MTSAKLLPKPTPSPDTAAATEKDRLAAFRNAFDTLCKEHGVALSIRIALEPEQKPADVLRYLVSTLENDPTGFGPAFDRKILAVPVIVPSESS